MLNGRPDRNQLPGIEANTGRWDTAADRGGMREGGRLDNLPVIVDRNRVQQGDTTENTIRMEPLGERWRSFGWAAREWTDTIWRRAPRRFTRFRSKPDGRAA